MAVTPPKQEHQPLNPTDLDPYKHVPLGILEQADTRMFPHATPEHMLELSQYGWARYGVATAIINERGEILMLEHAESAKLTEGLVGPLMETVRLRPGQVESTEQTLYRAVQEELGIEDPTQLKLKARILGGWTLNKWPAGNINGHAEEHVLGVNPIVVVPDEIALRMPKFIRTEEIRTAKFMPAKQIEIHDKLRPGILPWLGGLTARGLLDRHHGAYHPVNFENVEMLQEPGWSDAVFANVDL